MYLERASLYMLGGVCGRRFFFFLARASFPQTTS